MIKNPASIHGTPAARVALLGLGLLAGPALAAPAPTPAKPPSGKPAAPTVNPPATAKPPFEGPWQDFPRSYPQPRYEQDPGYKPEYRFGVTKAFPPYKDPDIAVAEKLPDPLLNPAFKSYNLIIIISKTPDPFFGAPQTMRIYKRGEGLLYYWLISTGMKGFETPSGYFTPQGFSSRHWSQSWDAPMLWSVFFNGGQALHSSLDRFSLSQLGRTTDSHGCVHVEDYRSEELFHLVGQSGFGPVDLIDRNSGQATGGKKSGYKTLIIIGPTARWKAVPGHSPRVTARNPVAPASQEPAAPDTLTKRTGSGVRHTLKIPGEGNEPSPDKLF